MKILAIDDNAVNLAAIEQSLGNDYEVVPMISGKRALRYLNSEKADLILLDVMMPGMDGMETLKEIRKLSNGTTVPVIFLTALDDKNITLEGSRYDVIDCIIKPFEKAELKRRIDQAFADINAEKGSGSYDSPF